MEKVTLKLHEFYVLEAELNGVTNRQTGEVLAKGLLNEKIKLTTKYWLHDLTKKVAAEKESVEKLKEELIKKYGTADEEGNISIPMYINEVIDDETKEIVSRDINPDFVKFQNDFNGLLEEDRELEYKGFKLEEFDNVETDGNYSTFFKLIKVSE
jgi:N-methylhydantoinase B/oxoprolinase/acetone carboxylase alpha subunit